MISIIRPIIGLLAVSLLIIFSSPLFLYAQNCSTSKLEGAVFDGLITEVFPTKLRRKPNYVRDTLSIKNSRISTEFLNAKFSTGAIRIAAEMKQNGCRIEGGAVSVLGVKSVVLGNLRAGTMIDLDILVTDSKGVSVRYNFKGRLV